MAKDITVSQTTRLQELSHKPEPNLKKAVSSSLHCSYAAASDFDSNLLIFFSGLGDTDTPFFRLGQSLKLPQTAILSIRGYKRIALLEEEAYQYFESFDHLGDILTRPDPSEAISLTHKILDHLINTCKWPPAAIHLFGYAHGGSLASEVALRYSTPLGSLVTISGPLLSLPTIVADKRSKTPVLVWCRPGQNEIQEGPFKKGLEVVKFVKTSKSVGGMPSSQDEWRPIMQFWSEQLRRLSPWQFSDSKEEVYQVT